jgi:hypothetical protein
MQALLESSGRATGRAPRTRGSPRPSWAARSIPRSFKAGKLAKPWYRDAAEKLVKEQREDGSWKPDGAQIDSSFPVIATACGLYLLGPPKK